MIKLKKIKNKIPNDSKVKVKVKDGELKDKDLIVYAHYIIDGVEWLSVGIKKDVFEVKVTDLN